MKPIEDILETMKTIRWDLLPWSYRECQLGEIQSLLANLFEDNFDQRQRTGQIIENACALQGSLSEAAFYLMPFIREGVVRHLDRAESALSLFTNMANSLASSCLTRVRFRSLGVPFVFFIPDDEGMELFLDHACQMGLAGMMPPVMDSFGDLSELAQQEAVSFASSLCPHSFSAEWMLDLKRSKQLSARVAEHVDYCLRDPVY